MRNLVLLVLAISIVLLAFRLGGEIIGAWLTMFVLVGMIMLYLSFKKYR